MRRPLHIDVEMPTRTEYVTQNVNITEKRAPTDESVKLLREMEDKAREQVEQSINVGGNGFECVVNIHKEALSMDTVAVALFKLNGRSLRAEARVEGWDRDDIAKLAPRLRDEVAKELANAILSPSLFLAMRNVGF